MAAATSASDSAAPSKRSRGLADIDPKFVSNVIITKSSLSFLPSSHSIVRLYIFYSIMLYIFLSLYFWVYANRVTGTDLSLLLMNVVTRFPSQISSAGKFISKWFSFSFLLFFLASLSFQFQEEEEEVDEDRAPSHVTAIDYHLLCRNCGGKIAAADRAGKL